MNDSMNNNKNSSSSIPVMKEEINVEKKTIEKGRVKISKVVKEESEIFSLPSTSEKVDIKRVPVNKIVESIPETFRYEGDMMIIPVMQEVTVIEKKLLLVEEIHVTKTSVSSEETKEITLRKEEITIQRDDNKNVENF